MAKDERRMEKRSMCAMSKVVVKSTGKRLICVLICDGILVRGLLFVTGCFAEKDLQGLTSCNGTEELTQVRRSSLAVSVERGS